MMADASPWARDDADAINRALAVDGGHLFVGGHGFTLAYQRGTTLSGYDVAPVKAACIAAGLPVIDSRGLGFDAALHLAIHSPMIAVGEPADAPALAWPGTRAAAPCRRPLPRGRGRGGQPAGRDRRRRGGDGMNPVWSLDRTSPAAGHPGLLLVLDHEDGPDGRTVCVIPGHLEWRITARGVVRLLDKDDVWNARLIAAAPQLRSALAQLLEWSARTGGWDAPCWQDARALLDGLRNPQAGP